MAGDWIKMRGNLWDDPRVGRLCDLTDSTEGPVIGALYWLWAAADQHTEDGFMPGLTLRQIDRKTGLAGFAAALCQVGWLVDGADGVVIVKFEEHNGASAKRRCMEAQRKANGRKESASPPEDVRILSASDADKKRTDQGQNAPDCGAREREEKRREEPQPDGCVGAASDAAPGEPAANRRGSRLSPNWILPKAWGYWAIHEYPAWDAAYVRAEGDKFRDFWAAKTGKDATKLDWEATWRNWCRNARGPALARASPSPSGLSAAGAATLEASRSLEKKLFGEAHEAV